MKEFGVVVHVGVHHLVTDRTNVIIFGGSVNVAWVRRSIDRWIDAGFGFGFGFGFGSNAVV